MGSGEAVPLCQVPGRGYFHPEDPPLLVEPDLSPALSSLHPEPLGLEEGVPYTDLFLPDETDGHAELAAGSRSEDGNGDGRSLVQEGREEVVLVGNGPALLRDATAIGNDLTVNDRLQPCVKDGQLISVGTGAPTLLIPEMAVLQGRRGAW